MSDYRLSMGLAAAAAIAAAALLAGCGNDDDYHPNVSPAYLRQTAVLPRQTLASQPTLGGGGGDSLAGGGGASADPLTAGDSPAGPAAPGDATGTDALSGDSIIPPSALTADQRRDPILNHAEYDVNGHLQLMTDHSHWLRGEVRGGSVTVYLNGAAIARLGVPGSNGDVHVDKDISPPFHKGANTVTFHFIPSVPSGMAHLDVLESEHDPPIAPLASFDTATLPNPSLTRQARDASQSNVFIAQ